MKKNTITFKSGFTLPEILVAITISVMIMGGIFGFLTSLQKDILQSKESTQSYTNLTDFISTMNNLNKLYSSANVIVSGSGVYNVALLTRPDKSAGVLIGVVEQKIGNTSRIDPVANKNIYGKKVIAYQKLTASQITSILASTANLYTIDFSDEGLFKSLPVTDFFITPYNAGKILEYTFFVEIPFYENLIGKQRGNIEPEVTILPFTLDF